MKVQRMRTTIVLTMLFGLILLLVLIGINVKNSNMEKKRQRHEMRRMVRNAGFELLCSPEEAGYTPDYEEYGVVYVKRNEEPILFHNSFKDYTDEELISHAESFEKNKKGEGTEGPFVYIKRRWEEKNIRVYFVMKDGFAGSGAASMRRFSIYIFLLGSMVFFGIAALIASWLVKPSVQALAATKEFVSNASHELKTPLTIIDANIELLRENYGENRQLDYIHQEVSKMNRLIGEMLTLVKMESMQAGDAFEKFSLSKAFMDAVLPFESVAYENGLKLDIFAQEDMKCCGSREQLQRVLSVLMDNAVSYASENGRIEARLYKKQKKIYMSVANTGEKIPMELREQIFSRFYCENEDSEKKERHFGLGLAIADEIVKRHKGKILVEYREGMNVFTVVLH